MFVLLFIYTHWKRQEMPFDLQVIGIFSVLLSIYDLGIVLDSLLTPSGCRSLALKCYCFDIIRDMIFMCPLFGKPLIPLKLEVENWTLILE